MNDAHDKLPVTPRLQHLVWIYAGFSSLWIITPDVLLAWLAIPSEQPSQFSSIKGLLFIAIASLLLHVLLHRASMQFKQAAELVVGKPAPEVWGKTDSAIFPPEVRATLLWRI